LAGSGIDFPQPRKAFIKGAEGWLLGATSSPDVTVPHGDKRISLGTAILQGILFILLSLEELNRRIERRHS